MATGCSRNQYRATNTSLPCMIPGHQYTKARASSLSVLMPRTLAGFLICRYARPMPFGEETTCSEEKERERTPPRLISYNEMSRCCGTLLCNLTSPWNYSLFAFTWTGTQLVCGVPQTRQRSHYSRGQWHFYTLFMGHTANF